MLNIKKNKIFSFFIIIFTLFSFSINLSSQKKDSIFFDIESLEINKLPEAVLKLDSENIFISYQSDKTKETLFKTRRSNFILGSILPFSILTAVLSTQDHNINYNSIIKAIILMMLLGGATFEYLILNNKKSFYSFFKYFFLRNTDKLNFVNKPKLEDLLLRDLDKIENYLNNIKNLESEEKKFIKKVLLKKLGLIEDLLNLINFDYIIYLDLSFSNMSSKVFSTIIFQRIKRIQLILNFFGIY